MRHTACALALCIATSFAATAQPASDIAPAGTQVTAVTQPHAARPNAVLRRTIEPSEARGLWDDPQIKNFRGLAENAWDFERPDGVPGFAPLPADAAKP